MKELSIEEKSKRYDEALARMSRAFNSNRCTLGFMNEIFPEPKESEDEKIRKEIIATIHLYYGEPLEDEAKEMIAWLEKQGEQKPWSEEDERIVTELIGIFESAVDGGHVIFPYRLLKDYIRVLKSCLPQSQWKPSDEQVYVLDKKSTSFYR